MKLHPQNPTPGIDKQVFPMLTYNKITNGLEVQDRVIRCGYITEGIDGLFRYYPMGRDPMDSSMMKELSNKLDSLNENFRTHLKALGVDDEVRFTD